jgi:hypothetical protein
MIDTKNEIQSWSKLYGKEISIDDYSEIYRNIDGFISLLKTWDDKEKTRLADERDSGLRNTNSSN